MVKYNLAEHLQLSFKVGLHTGQIWLFGQWNVQDTVAKALLPKLELVQQWVDYIFLTTQSLTDNGEEIQADTIPNQPLAR